MTNNTITRRKKAQFSRTNQSDEIEKNAEKAKSDDMALALAVSAIKAFRNEKDLRCIPLPSKPKQNSQHLSTSFSLWKNADVRQAGHMHHLTMHLNVFREDRTDVIMPFSVWPLKRNQKLYNKSDNELAAYFNKHLSESLNQLKIEPEYYYVITGEANPHDKTNTRHIHGCIRLPGSFCDKHRLEAADAIYDALKRAGGLTNTLRNLIEKEGLHRKDALFAISANNNNKPHGYMADIRTELSPKEGLLKWSSYITDKRNQPNTIRRTANLESQVGQLNDSLYAEIKSLRSCSDWTDNKPGFTEVTKAWTNVLVDYIRSSSNTKEHERDVVTGQSTTISEEPLKPNVLEKKGFPIRDRKRPRNVNLKIEPGTKLKNKIRHRKQRTLAEKKAEEKLFYDR